MGNLWMKGSKVKGQKLKGEGWRFVLFRTNYVLGW